MHNMTSKPMTVQGFTVTEKDQQMAVLWMMSRIRREGVFKAAELEHASEAWGFTGLLKCRFADRMIQAAKKAGLIEYNRGIGFWVRGPNAPEPSDG